MMLSLTTVRTNRFGIADVPHQIMVHAHLQILPDRVDTVWLHIIYVWLACPRKGDPHGAYSTQVRYPRILCLRVSRPTGPCAQLACGGETIVLPHIHDS
jgi:hypothetical protein